MYIKTSHRRHYPTILLLLSISSHRLSFYTISITCSWGNGLTNTEQLVWLALLVLALSSEECYTIHCAQSEKEQKKNNKVEKKKNLNWKFHFLLHARSTVELNEITWVRVCVAAFGIAWKSFEFSLRRCCCPPITSRVYAKRSWDVCWTWNRSSTRQMRRGKNSEKYTRHNNNYLCCAHIKMGKSSSSRKYEK